MTRRPTGDRGHKMKIKEGYVIKKLGTGYVVVTVGDASRDFNGVISMNPSGAFLWQRILEGDDSREKLVRAMTPTYFIERELWSGPCWKGTRTWTRPRPGRTWTNSCKP